MDIKTSTTSDLKALAYDHIVEMERVQASLQTINSEIALRAKAPKELPVEAPVAPVEE